MLKADVSELSVGSIFIDRSMKMEPTESSETSAFSTRTPGRYPKEDALHIKHGESLKSRMIFFYLTLSIVVQYTTMLFQVLFLNLLVFEFSSSRFPAPAAHRQDLASGVYLNTFTDIWCHVKENRSF